LNLFGAFLEDNGHSRNPKDITAEHVLLFLKQHDNSPQNLKHYSSAINNFLKSTGNYSYDQAKPELPRIQRVNVDWLTAPGAQHVINIAATEPLEAAVIHLGLCLLMRRSEIVRLKMSDVDFNGSVVHVHGKGRGGGKFRTVPFHPETRVIICSWLLERRKIAFKISQAGKEVPEFMFIYFIRGRTGYMKRSTIDNVIKRISARAGVHFSSHTLRRTGGRILWKAGVPPVTIAQIMGHADTRTTLDYIGANIDDMNDAMKTYRDYMAELKTPGTENQYYKEGE